MNLYKEGPMHARLAAALILAAAAPLAAQAPPPAQQIAAAVLALPPSLRADATVMGYAADGKLIVLREGRGQMICLANDPKGEEFHIACYHNSMEPFMARGRALRASGVTGDQVDTVRFREVRDGKLLMPRSPAILYQLFGGTYDPVKKEVAGAKALYVVYIPFATTASTGLSDKPSGTLPWLMFPGTPKAHIMFTPAM
jgi:hypothetical protein